MSPKLVTNQAKRASHVTLIPPSSALLTPPSSLLTPHSPFPPSCSAVILSISDCLLLISPVQSQPALSTSHSAPNSVSHTHSVCVSQIKDLWRATFGQVVGPTESFFAAQLEVHAWVWLRADWVALGTSRQCAQLASTCSVRPLAETRHYD